MLIDFQREYLLRLPLPLAQLYSRAHNAKDARGRHDNTFYLCEALIKLAVAPAIACYLSEIQAGQPRVAALDRLLLQLALPSLGQWLAILRELSRHFSTRVDANHHPLGRLHEQLTCARKNLPGVLALYRRIKNGPDGAPSDDQSCSVLQLFDALIQYRNLVFGHGGPRFDSFFENEMGPLLFPAVNDLFAENVVDWLGKPGARLIYLTEVRTLDAAQMEVGVRELVGRDSERTSPLRLTTERASALLPNRVAVLWPGRPVPLRLDPLLVYRETDQGEDVLFLNRDRNSRQVEYLSYFSGKTERETAMAPALAAMLSLAAGTTVTEERLAEFQKQSLAETPSVEVLLEEQPVAGRMLGDYELLGLLGRGGMGVVYLARQQSLGRLVALKTLPADVAADEVALARLRREIRALGRCDHPHIVKVLTSGILPEGQPYYTMEYVPGCDLERVWQELKGASGNTAEMSGSSWRRAVLTASKKLRAEAVKPTADAPVTASLPLPSLPELPAVEDDPGGYVRRVAALIRDAARAVQVVHEQNLIHRDVKPANLMLSPDGGRVVLMDFGLAKGHTVSRPLSSGGGFLGTLRYAAPEQLAAANLKVGAEADVRGLGVTLWELLTRRRLFAEAGDEVQLAKMVYDQDVPRLRSVEPSFDRDLEAIVARATERRVGDRIAKASQLADYLQLWLEGKPLPIRTPGTGELLRRWMRAHQPLVASATATLVTIVAVVVIAFLQIKWALEREKNANNLLNTANGKLKLKQDELEGETARSWVLPLALERGPLSDQEIEVLCAVTAKREERLTIRFIEEGAKEPRFTRRLGARSEYAMHAAIGLDKKKREEVEGLLGRRLQAPGIEEESRRDLALALAALGDLSRSSAVAATPLLIQALANATDDYTLQALSEVLSAVATRLEPKEAAAALSQALVDKTDERTVETLVKGLLAVATRMEPKEAAATFVLAMTKTTEAKTLRALAEGLSAAATRLEARDAVARLTEAMAKTAEFARPGNRSGDPEALGTLVDGLSAVVARLEPEEAAAILAQAMAKASNADIRRLLAESLSAAATRLEAKEAVARLTEAMAKTNDADILKPLAVGLSAVAERLARKEAAYVSAEVAAMLTRAMAEKTNSQRLSTLAVGLSAVAAQMEPKGAAATLTEAIAKTNNAAARRALARGLTAVAARLEPKEAVRVLAEAAALLTEAMTKTTDELSLKTLAEGLAAVAARLEAKEAVRVLAEAAGMLTHAMGKTVNSYRLETLAKGLLAAAAPMEPKEAAATLIKTFAQTSDAFAQRALAQGLSAAAVRLEPKEAAAMLIQALRKTTDAKTRRILAEGLARLAAGLNATEAGRVLSESAALFCKDLSVTFKANSLTELSAGLSALAAQMEPKEAAAILIEPMIHTLKTTQETIILQMLAEGLSELAPRLEPKEAKRVLAQVAAILIEAMGETKHEYPLEQLARGLSAVVARMESSEAARVSAMAAAILTKGMDKTNEALAQWELADGLAAVAPGLEPKEAAAMLIQAMAKTTDARGLEALGEGLSVVVARLERKEAADKLAEAAGILIQALTKTTDSKALTALVNGLSVVLGDNRRGQRAVALACAVGFLGDGNSLPGALRFLKPMTEPLPRRLTDQDLVELLKDPLCVGPARHAVLDELGYCYQCHFASQWDFVRFAQEQNLSLDFSSPPNRR
jgi:serine/threonine protein kinase